MIDGPSGSAEGASTGDIRKARAHWVTRDTIAWDVDINQAVRFTLHFDLEGGLMRSPHGVSGGQDIELKLDERGLSKDIVGKFPHLRGCAALRVGADELSTAAIALKGRLAVSALDGEDRPVGVTGVQIAGVLDDLYAYEDSLGVVYDGAVPILKLWAPTARSVRLQMFDDAHADTPGQAHVMTDDPDTGVWSITGAPNWTGKYYLYDVEVYVPSTGKVERNLVTDPYSVSLSMNSKRSQIVDLSDPSLMPEGWAMLEKPPLDAPEDIVIYELHVRDFSAHDPRVPEERRGTFLAFTQLDSHGMRHLRKLAQAGLTHVHLLPVADIATINEDKSEWEQPDFDTLAGLPPESATQQEIVSSLRNRDGYNWGYDPFHYTAPEGSYSTEPDGPARILEFRKMVQALNAIGLRVVMDVVYNHTYASGQSEKSVLDRVVPGYYHRLNADGEVETSTCCENTATEHNMMRKLMVDSLVTWATAYKVDSFRFDLMGHHMVEDMVAVKHALQQLTPDKDGVDGSQVYIYGEGWDFGEVANGTRGLNASQLHMSGLGIGTFNDRLRDAVRGGSALRGHLEQGFINGLYCDPNEAEDRPANEQRAALLRLADQIRVALAGNLAQYSFENWRGQWVTGRSVDYSGSPTGYAADPQEHIAYVSAHDNETLFDANQYKAPEGATMAQRVRMQNLGISLVALSQGVPFFHGGIDMLRSKSFDRDSVHSGDWFNKLDFTYRENNWGVGLPPAEKNQVNWPLMRPRLANPELRPTPEDIKTSVAHFQEMLHIRRSSPLFRLRNAKEVMERLRFHNTGPNQVPGVIVMSLLDVGTSAVLDPNHDLILVVFNATNRDHTCGLPSLVGIALDLHPVLAESSDPVVRAATFDAGSGEFTVPERTTAVFVALEGTVSHPPFAVGQTSVEGRNRAGIRQRGR